jgi:uncharacterized DUF497 family protein
MQFEWDPKTAAINLRDHRVSFEEAATALEDDLSLTGDDPDHSIDEARQITFGVSRAGRLLVISHTERGEHIRIISARLATKSERKLHEED